MVAVGLQQLLVFQLVSYVCLLFVGSSVAPLRQLEEEEERIYFMKRLAGGGCPYTASWLANVNLYRSLPWWIDITKMEAASFTIFDRARWKFQLSDPDAYFVHHMSMYEHLNHKKYGFATAQNKTIRLSQAAFEGECGSLVISKTKKYIALVPFYGGLPPGVTKDLSVKSIGQGNSLVDGNTKGYQAMATVCSCLRYFGHVIIGVARAEDLSIINSYLNEKMSSTVRRSVNVVMFRMAKPANLPFHMLAWGQRYVRLHNCQQFYQKLPTGSSKSVRTVRSLTVEEGNNTAAIDGAVNATESISVDNNGTSNEKTFSEERNRSAIIEQQRQRQPYQQQLQRHHEEQMAATYAIKWDDINFDRDLIDLNRIPKKDNRYDICHPNAIMKSHGGPIDVAYVKKSLLATPGSGHHRNRVQPNAASRRLQFTAGANPTPWEAVKQRSLRSAVGGISTAASGQKSFVPIEYVYYTECDQVVRFDSEQTLAALTAASNATTFFSGRRKEKGRDSEPEDYMGTLNQWRECGAAGFSLTWPKENVVRADS